MNNPLRLGLDGILSTKHSYKNIIDVFDNHFIKNEFWEKIEEQYSLEQVEEEEYKHSVFNTLAAIFTQIPSNYLPSFINHSSGGLHSELIRITEFRLFRKYYNKIFKI